MKTTNKKVAYIFPVDLCEKIKNSANDHGNTINHEIITLLNKVFDERFVELDSTIKKIVSMFAKKNDFTIAEAVNYLISTKISVFEEVHDNIIEEANKEYEAEISEYKKEAT